MDAAHGPIVEDIVSLFTCMVVLIAIASYWVEVLVSTGSGSRDVSFFWGSD